MQSLNTVDENKKHIVFLDGYVMSKSNHDDLLTACDRWREEDKRNRTLSVRDLQASLVHPKTLPQHPVQIHQRFEI
jgi:hypothetical protein